MFTDNFYNISLKIILTLLILFLVIYISPYIKDIALFIVVILFPIIISYIFYYIFRPLRNFLESKKIPRILSILIIFMMFFSLLVLIYGFIGPSVYSQISDFISTPKKKISEVKDKTIDVMNYFNFSLKSRQELQDSILAFLQYFTRWITENITYTFSSIATIASYFVTTPFILFYLLKEDHQLAEGFMRAVPVAYEANCKSILSDIDNVLSSYITGQVTVSAIVGTLIFIGYSIIGLHYAALLAFIAFIFNLIPFFGAFISTIPAILIGFSQTPMMIVKILIIICIVHLLDMNLISPRIVGSRLQIHPITIIILLISSISLAGFLGLFLIIPLYAVARVLIKHMIELYKG